MKRKHLTFVYQDMELNTINLMQWGTSARTLEQAWEEAHAKLCQLKSIDKDMEEFSGRFVMVGGVMGLVSFIDKSVPLRRATPQEARQLELEAT